MRGKHDFGLLTGFIKCHVDLLGPFQGIAYQCAPKGVDVVDRGHDVLGRPEGLEIGKPGVHLRRRLGAWRVLKLHADAVDSQCLEILFDDDVRWDEAQVAGGRVFTDRLVDMTKGTARQQYTVLEKQSAAHCIAGINVFRYRMVHEADRGDDLDLPAT
ncbi:MAG: hypothetical protein PVF79_17230, partial [Desulfobacterales bacterium]